jgi:hypothetical protein
MTGIIKKFGIIALSGMIVFSGCKNKSENEGEGLDSAALATKEKATKVFYAVPSPAELALMIKATGAKFDKGILNSVDNASKYATIKSKALNLGVYGADLSYVSTFDQTQESMVYMNTCKKLADGLGLTGAIDEEIIKRMEANLNKKDSLVKIISDTYMATDTYLKENERGSESALVVAGGWIEGMYISIQVANANKNNEAIMKRIAEQKDILENLMGLLGNYASAEPAVEEIVNELKPLQAIYNNIKPTGQQGEVKTDTSAMKTTIESTVQYNLSPEQLAEITKILVALRGKIIA